MKRMVVFVLVVTLVGAAGAYASPQREGASAQKAIPQIGKAAAVRDSSLSGKVAETMNAGGYTYICLEKNGKKTWVAIPETKVSVGQFINLVPGQEMRNFTSKTLNRTFDSIIFSAGPVSGQTGAGNDKKLSEKHGGSKAAVIKNDEKISVERASGPDGYTISEIFAQRTKLNKKTATVRGKVVKVSEGIMGKNWIHLQDGTGEPAKGTHNLVVTSDDLPKVGDVVTAKGTIYKDKDFGSGYTYKVIMEKASIQH